MKKHSSFHRLLKNKYFIISIIIIVVLILWYTLTHRNTVSAFESTPATIGTVVEMVSVTGTVSPVDKASLAFQKSGVIKSIPVKVGDYVKKGDLIASLNDATDIANLQSAQATLADMSRGLRPEEYAADQSSVDIASTTLANALVDAMDAVHNSYTQAANAVTNYADYFFNNPRTGNPLINIRVQSDIIQININNERLAITDVLNNWNNDANNITTDNVAETLSRTEGYASSIKQFLNDLSAIVNDINQGNSAISQTAINTNLATMTSALSNLNQAIDTLSTADTELKNATSAYTQAQNTFTLQQSRSSPDAIAAQAAKVAAAQAEVDNDKILSPIDGIVTQEDPNVGEFATAGQGGFAVQSNGQYKIEAFVPEADIAKIAIGDLASSTLDAYGSYIDFPAQVAIIDPAETVLEGVPTYKVTLYFVNPDSRIRSGMTSNLEILTHEAVNVLEVPYRALSLTATSTTVRLVNPDNKTYKSVLVTTGLKGSDGTIEITSGLNVGDKVVTYIK